MSNNSLGTVSRCTCGARKSKHANYCNKCSAERSRRLREESQVVVRSGRCPQCGAGLRYNGAILGWWQCEQYGSDQFRKDLTKPACSFQCFTA